MQRAAFGHRRRRGAEIIEFAIIFPVFLFLFFGIMEWSWYFYQRAAVVEATRLGCQAASHMDPNAGDSDNNGRPDHVDVAYSVIKAEVGRKAGIQCDGDCPGIIEDLSDPAFTPRRIRCMTEVPFRSLTGFLGSDTTPGGPGSELAAARWGTPRDGRMLPQYLVGRATAVFQEAD